MDKESRDEPRSVRLREFFQNETESGMMSFLKKLHELSGILAFLRCRYRGGTVIS